MVASYKGYRCHSADDVTNLGEALLEYDTAVASILILSLSPPPYGNAEGIRLTPVGTSFNGGKLQRIPLPFLRRRHESWESRSSIVAPRLLLSSVFLNVRHPMVIHKVSNQPRFVLASMVASYEGNHCHSADDVMILANRAARFWRRGYCYHQSLLLIATLRSFGRSSIDHHWYGLQWWQAAEDTADIRQTTSRILRTEQLDFRRRGCLYPHSLFVATIL
jgi:hypothetical protein